MSRRYQEEIAPLPAAAEEPTTACLYRDDPIPLAEQTYLRIGPIVCGTLFFLLVAGIVGWTLGLGEIVRQSVAAGHLLDWVMGTLCLIWLLVILKAPWDLYFQAHEVAFEQQRARERNLPEIAGRAEYIRLLKTRLGWVAVGTHLISAAIVAAIARFSGGAVGYYFAAFYLIATAFRPGLAGYVYLYRKLRALGQETRYPREDILEVRDQLHVQGRTLRDVAERMQALEGMLHEETNARRGEMAELRQNVHAIGREMETTVSRLTDNQEVITGIRAFVRLISQSARTES